MYITLETVMKWMNFPITHIGGAPLTLISLFTAFLVFVGFMFVSGVIQRMLSVQLQKGGKMSSGVSYAILRFVHYGIVIIAVIVSAQVIGLNLGGLAVVFGFLSVGIGFGLQNITSNFISGIILLIQRPVSVGDFVNVDGEIGKVLHINMRSTIIMNLDNVAMIVPNSKFVENNVTNQSIEDEKVKLHCPGGVSYGADVELVKATLLKVASDHKDVLEKPESEVRFLEFGASSLDFYLTVWTSDPKGQFLLRSQINYAINAAFKKVNIEIPFTQRDLHLKMTPAVEILAKGKDA